MYGNRTAAAAIRQDFSNLDSDEVAAVKSELWHTKVTLTESVSKTVAALDYFGAKCDRFENQTEENLAMVHSKLNKLSRTQLQQVSAFTALKMKLIFYLRI